VAADETGPASHDKTFGPVRHGLQYSAHALARPLSQG
jgi:hypothetical protein